MKYSKRTVLVVDDSELNRNILKDFLSDTYNVIEASNGKEAFDLIKKEEYFISAILLDIQMPVLNGFEFLEEIRKEKFLSRIPVVVITGNDEKDTELKCLKLGAIDFVRKPFDSYVVHTRLKNAITLREAVTSLSDELESDFVDLCQLSSFSKSCEIILRNNKDVRYDLVVAKVFDFQSIINNYGKEKANQFTNSVIYTMLNLDLDRATISRLDISTFAFFVRIDNDSHNTQNSIKKFDEIIKNNSKIDNVKIKYALIEDVNHTQSLEYLIDQCFKMLDRIKDSYRENFINYTPALKQEFETISKIEQCMNKALVEKQFKVFYQPKYDISGDKNIIAGAEALIRWVHPELGFMNPGIFIPLFEKNGFIGKLDEYVLKTVCEDIRGWIDTNVPVYPISINLSRLDFLFPNIAERIVEIVDSYNIPHNLLHFEVTETLFSTMEEAIKYAIHCLHKAGFIIELDDFGSGYSNLYSLQSLDLDIIKLDLSLIKNDSNSTEKNVINFVYNIMKLMKMKTVQEGVETKEQLERVKTLGCDLVQGYYFSKPLPKIEYEKFCSLFSVK